MCSLPCMQQLCCFLCVSYLVCTIEIPRRLVLCSSSGVHQWGTFLFLTLYTPVIFLGNLCVPCLVSTSEELLSSLPCIHNSDSKSVLCYLSGMHHWGTSFLDLYSRLRSLCVPYLVSTIEEPLSFLPWMHHWGSKVVLCSYLICTNEEPVFLTWYAPMRNMCSLPCMHQWYSKAVLRCCWLHNARKIWIRILEMDWVHGIMRRRKSIHHFSHTRYLCSCSFEMRSFSKRHTFSHSLTLWFKDWLTHSRYPQDVTLSPSENTVLFLWHTGFYMYARSNGKHPILKVLQTKSVHFWTHPFLGVWYMVADLL